MPGTAAVSVAHEEDPRRKAVPFGVALRRSVIGLAFGALYVLVTLWFYSDGLVAFVPALMFLHRKEDRRSRWAFAAALLIAMPVTLTAAALLKGRLPQPWDGFLFSLFGALPGSVAYAAVTRIEPKA